MSNIASGEEKYINVLQQVHTDILLRVYKIVVSQATHSKTFSITFEMGSLKVENLGPTV